MGLKWGVRPSDTRKLVPFWGHKGHFSDPFWTHLIARYAIFPTEKCPKMAFFDPFWPLFRPSRAIKMTFLAFFRDILVSFIEYYQNLFIFFRFFEIFLGFSAIFSPFFQYFRFLGAIFDVSRGQTCKDHISGYPGSCGLKFCR